MHLRACLTRLACWLVGVLVGLVFGSTAELDKIELVPDAVFAAEAPARLQGAADVASDASEADRAAAAHRHKMNRLTFELETRKRCVMQLPAIPQPHSDPLTHVSPCFVLAVIASGWIASSLIASCVARPWLA